MLDLTKVGLFVLIIFIFFRKMVNVDSESVMAQKVEKEEAVKKSQEKKIKFGNVEFDEKHYLNTRLAKDEKEKEIVIRLLPFSETELSPFKKIYVHSVKVPGDNGEKKWKKFMCPIGMHKSDKCPFCETAKKAKKLKFEADNEELKKRYNSIEFMNSPKDYWLVRCIDRANEDDGVKFWRFPDAKDGDGIWDKIYALFETKKRRGVEIFDLYKGKDLVITVKKQTDSAGKEKMVYQIQDDEVVRPLSESEEQMEKWVNDPMKWDDVYSIKDYDYMSLVVQGEVPVWSKDLNKWISKTESDKITQEAEKQEAEENLRPESKDFSTFTVDTGSTRHNESVESDTNNVEDELPF